MLDDSIDEQLKKAEEGARSSATNWNMLKNVPKTADSGRLGKLQTVTRSVEYAMWKAKSVHQVGVKKVRERHRERGSGRMCRVEWYPSMLRTFYTKCVQELSKATINLWRVKRHNIPQMLPLCYSPPLSSPATSNISWLHVKLLNLFFFRFFSIFSPSSTFFCTFNVSI